MINPLFITLPKNNNVQLDSLCNIQGCLFMENYKKIKLKNGKTKDEHRLIMEKYLGRNLEKWEVVHHKDRNKKNNDLNNLELMTSSEHMKLHLLAGDIPQYKIKEEEKKHLSILNASVSQEIAQDILNSKEKNIVLAKKYNVSRWVIYKIKNRVTWKHLIPA